MTAYCRRAYGVKNKVVAAVLQERASPMSYVYDASAIEVLSGLEPVRKRPGMFTDTSRPNHMAQEVLDNSVDEAIAGYARNIEVTLYQDGSLAVKDDGRGVPVVNALSTRLEVWVQRAGQEYHMAFAHGEKVSDLAVVGHVPRLHTG